MLGAALEVEARVRDQSRATAAANSGGYGAREQTTPHARPLGWGAGSGVQVNVGV